MRNISEILSYIDSQYDLSNSAKLVLDGNNVLGKEGVKGICIETKEKKNSVDIDVTVEKGVRIENPVHMCFGVLDQKLIQKLNINFVVEKNAHVSILAHCIFPDVEKVKHIMNGKITVKEGAFLEYIEKHIHDEKGELVVSPHSVITIGKRASFKTTVEILEGKAGRFDLSYRATALEESKVDMSAKVSAFGDDRVRIDEGVTLKGKNSKAVIRSKVASRDKSEVEVYTTVIASKEGTRGHIECTEIIVDDGVVKAYPNIEARHPKARVTHEASLGGVDKKQLETLMSRGLSEKEAIELIIKSLLK